MGLMSRNRGWLMCGVAANAVVMCGQALAQDAENTQDQGSNTTLSEIVVGAGVPKVAIDTPQAVTVIDQEAIDEKQPTTIGDIFTQIPGVSIVGSDRIGGQSFNIRGIGDLGAADESKIIVSVDGAVKFYEQYRMGSFFSDPELYKRVEVLRGPASSTLYGSGALGGVITFTTKDAEEYLQPGETGAVQLKTQYNSNKDGILGSVIAAYAFNDQTSVLLNGNVRKQGEYETGNGTPIAGSDFLSFSGLGKVTHHFGDANEQTIRLSYQRWQSNADDTAYSQTGTLGFGTIDRDITDQTVILSYENPASDNPWLNLKANLSLSDTHVVQSDSSLAAVSPSQLFQDGEYTYRTWAGKLENTFEKSGAGFMNYLTIGTQLSYQQRLATSTSGAIGFHPEGTDTKLGLFAQDEFIWNERLTLIPGIRADFVNLEPDSAISGASSMSDVALSPKLAVMYKFNETLSLFGSAAHTERMPTLDELFSTSGATGTYPGGRSASISLDKETSNNFEAGFGLSFRDILSADDGLQLKTTGFYNLLDNLITTNPDTGLATAVPYYVNVEKAEIYGVEIEGAYESRYAFGNLAFSRIFGKNTDTGQNLDTIPATTLALTLGGRLPQYDVSFGWRGLFAESIATGATSDGPFAGYAVHDLFADWTPEDGRMAGWQVRASVENVFDKVYRNNLAGDDGPGRTFKLTLAKKLSW
ncbi:TonB-dependent receptor [Labrenzia aggregata]|uniref:TonB-dependent receptor n=2 Tax=Roseibium aggregatum TaxID=187304 RepID=A0A926P1A7_9HYPH|nr:TonB-dependent receptor [Roseibium aggregatum]